MIYIDCKRRNESIKTKLTEHLGTATSTKATALVILKVTYSALFFYEFDTIF